MFPLVMHTFSISQAIAFIGIFAGVFLTSTSLALKKLIVCLDEIMHCGMTLVE
jgi:hypothetical protein